MIRIHGAGASPFVRKVRVAMAEKKLPYELIPVMPMGVSAEFKKISPLGKIPVYEDGDFTLPDSSCIIAYLERVHPSPALYPTDAKEFGKAIFLEEVADSRVAEAVGGAFMEGVIKPRLLKQPTDEARVKKAVEEQMPPLLDYLESLAPSGDGIVGGRFSVADIAIGSMFVNWMHAGQAIDAKRHPRMAAHVARIHARPSFAALIEEERKQFAAI